MEKIIFTQDILEREKELTRLLSRENDTYAKFELVHGGCKKQILYVKGTWYPTHFMMFVLDGQDAWNINAMQELVGHKAIELGMEVEEWLDQLYTYFCHQHVEGNYTFVSVGTNTKMLQCTFLDKALGERRSIKLMLHKISNCGQVAYQMLGLLVDTNTKQKEELAKKTRDIQRMAAEIRELRFNHTEHFQIEYDPPMNTHSTIDFVSVEPLVRYNRLFSNERSQALNLNIEQQPKYHKNWDDINKIQNTQYWEYDRDENNLYPILKPFINHQHAEDFDIQNKKMALRQQSYNVHQSISNHENISNNSHLEDGESSSNKSLKTSNNIHHNIPIQTNKRHEMHHFSYEVPFHYEEGLLKNYPKNDSRLHSKFNEAMVLNTIPKKSTIEKEIVTSNDFKGKKSISKPSSYKQDNKFNKTSWSLNPPILDNEIPHNNQYPSLMIVESSQNEKNDELSIKLEIFDEKPIMNNKPCNMDEIQQFESTHDKSLQHYSIIQQNEVNMNNNQTHSKVNFHHTDQNEKKGKIYYKTPKHSYSQLKTRTSGYNDDKELDYEISSNVSKSKSYVPMNHNNNDNYTRSSRWSTPSQSSLYNNDSNFKVELLTTSNPEDGQINTNSSKHVYRHCENQLNQTLESQTYVDEPRISHVHWGPISTSDEVQLSTNSMVPNIDSSNQKNVTLESLKDLEYVSNGTPILVDHPIHSILHHLGEQHLYHGHIDWSENLASDGNLQESQHTPITKLTPTHNFQAQESLHPTMSLSEDPLSIINIEDGNIMKNPQNSNKTPSFHSNITSFLPHHNVLEDTTENMLEDQNVGKSTNASSTFQSLENMTIPKNSNSIVIESTEELVNENKTVKLSKSPSFAQNVMSLFQSSSDKTQQTNSNENPNEAQSRMTISTNQSIHQEDNVSEVARQFQSESKDLLNDNNNNDDSLNISTLFASYHESRSARPSTTQSNIENQNKSIALNASLENDAIQHQNILNSNIEDEFIDDGQYHVELSHHKMDASRKASIDEVKKELFLKLGNQQPIGIPPSNNFINETTNNQSKHAIVDFSSSELIGIGNYKNTIENKQEVASFVLPNGTDQEPRRYSIDKIDSNELKDLQRTSKSTSTSRISLYSRFQDRPSKSKKNPQFTNLEVYTNNQQEDNINSSNINNDVEMNDKHVKTINEDIIRESQDEKSLKELESKVDNEDLVIHSKQIFMNKGENEDITNVFNKVEESLITINSHTTTSSNDDQLDSRNANDPNNSILCVARICFVFPGKITPLTTTQSHAATNTSSSGGTPNVHISSHSSPSIGARLNSIKNNDSSPLNYNVDLIFSNERS